MWTVRIDKSVDKRLKRIPNPDNKRIKQALYDLQYKQDKPEQLDIKSLEGRDCYRLRVGDWRLIMDIDGENKIFSVYTLVTRGDVYKK